VTLFQAAVALARGDTLKAPHVMAQNTTVWTKEGPNKWRRSRYEDFYDTAFMFLREKEKKFRWI
jgi:hypothetical protein